MKILRYQVATLTDGPELLDILTYVGQPFYNYSLKLKTKVWSYPGEQSIVVKSWENLVVKLTDRKFNSLDIRPDSSENGLPEEISRIDLLDICLEISPYSKNWQSYVGPEPEKRSAINQYMSLGSWEKSLKYHGTTRCPSLYSVTLFIEGIKLSDAEVFELFFENLAQCRIPPASIAAFDYGGNIKPVEDMHAYACRPSSKFGLLVDKFDALHQVMIAPKDQAQQLSTCLGTEVQLRDINIGNTFMSAVILKPEMLRNKEYVERAREFLI